MTEALKPLNWHRFGEVTLCEGEVGFQDARYAARFALERELNQVGPQIPSASLKPPGNKSAGPPIGGEPHS
jgi:hypothetical protein